MTRIFNTAGPCRPADHYMLPPERRLPGVRALIDQKHYFVVHAPRQTGKTTTLEALAERLNEEGRYVALHASCEAAQAAGEDVDAGIAAILRNIEEMARRLPEALRPEPVEASREIEGLSRLQLYLGRWAERSARPVVLFLDEIDSLVGNTLISVLRQLRSGYPQRPAAFPQSVALIGLRDVPSQLFDVKVEALTLRDFTVEEIGELLRQHTEAIGQPFTPGAVASLFELTGGQPGLVNSLARLLVEQLAVGRGAGIEAGHVTAAKAVLIQRRNAHLDWLVDRLREPQLRKVIEPILTGQFPRDEISYDDLRRAKDFGLVRSGAQGLEIANPIYREIVPRALLERSAGCLPVS